MRGLLDGELRGWRWRPPQPQPRIQSESDTVLLATDPLAAAHDLRDRGSLDLTYECSERVTDGDPDAVSYGDPRTIAERVAGTFALRITDGIADAVSEREPHHDAHRGRDVPAHFDAHRGAVAWG